mgnify:CR=1 FL=1
MKKAILTALFAVFTLVSFAHAQTTGISPNNIDPGGTTTVTVTGLQPNTTYTVKFTGVGEDPYGIWTTGERQVTTDANGVASWDETITNWPADNDYATTVGIKDPDNGHWSNQTTGNLHIKP